MRHIHRVESNLCGVDPMGAMLRNVMMLVSINEICSSCRPAAGCIVE